MWTRWGRLLGLGATGGGAGGIGLAALALIVLAAMAASLALAPPPAGLLVAALVPVLMAMALIDARWLIIPDGLNATALALGLAYAALASGFDPALQGAGLDAPLEAPFASLLAAVGGGDWLAGLIWSLVRGLATALAFLALRLGFRALRGRDGLGLGDVKLAGVAGVWLEPMGILMAVEIAALSALLVEGGRRLSGRAPARRDGRLPFGLFLAPAIWIAWAIGLWISAPWAMDPWATPLWSPDLWSARP